jgi:hypothetical protein
MTNKTINDNPSSLNKIWSVLSTSNRKNAFVILLLMLIGMVLETLSVAMVIPTVAFLVNQGKDQT